MLKTDKHVFFWSKAEVFSNWYPAEFVYSGFKFANSEQAYMWEKAVYFGDEKTADEILRTPDPKENKKLGRKVKGYDDKEWSVVRRGVMYRVCKEKFMQNEWMYIALMKTGNRLLVEASPCDKVWGIGLNQEDAKVTPEEHWEGDNLLGKVLTELREDITW